MAELTPINDFVLNGAEVNTIEPPPSMGPLAAQIICLVGTAPDRDEATLPLNEPIRLWNYTDAMSKLDTVGDRLGTLPHLARYLMEFVSCPLYVIVVEEGVDDDATEANIIGDVDATTGALTGIKAIKGCPETPTVIGCPGFSSVSIGQALSGVGRDIRCRPVIDGPNTNDMVAAEFSSSFGAEGTGEDKLTIIDPWFITKYDGLEVTMPASVAMIAAMASVEGYESPQNVGVSCLETSRNVSYKINDASTQANFLNKYGVATIAHTRMGGYSIIGNRTNTGRFISHVGLEDLLARKLEETSQPYMGENLTEDFMNQVVDSLNMWGQSLVADGVVPSFNAYLHPDKNNLENYKSGRWYLCVDYGRYSPNEHMVYELSVNDGMIEAWLEETVNG